jgi:cadmium resistance protein CadD (predicted permease)
MNLAALLGLAIVVFASTNLDDIFVLLGFFADSRLGARNVAVGQYIGIGALVVVSIAASLFALVLTPAYVGLLGAPPILIGVKRLFELRRDSKDAAPRAEARNGAFRQIAAVAIVTIANGGDNLGVYAPLFATLRVFEIVVTALVFAVMTALWLAIAHWLVAHPMFGSPIRRYGRILAPFALIGLGLYIVYEARSFALLRAATLVR